MATTAKRSRTEITQGQKREICRYQEAHQTANLQEIASHFNSEWGTEIKRNTVGDILRQKNKWLQVPADSSNILRDRAPKFKKLEESLFLWFCQASSQNAVISEPILLEKAKYFGEHLNITEEEFKYSSGWLANFKKRYDISKRVIVGEAQGADLRGVMAGRVELQKELKDSSMEI